LGCYCKWQKLSPGDKMSNDVLKYVVPFATYSLIFGKPYKKSKLIEHIKELPLGGLLNLLSQLSSLSNPNSKDDPEIRENFISFLEELDPTIKYPFRGILQGYLLYSKQGLLAVWKWLLAYGDETKIGQNFEDVRTGVNALIYLCIIISDFLEDEEAVKHLEYVWVRNVSFNDTPDPILSTARAAWIYTELAKDKSCVKLKEYVDINADFETAYHYSLKEYLTVIFGLFSVFLTPEKNPDISWNKNIDIIFSETTINEKAKEIVKPLLLDFKEAKQWAIEKLDSPWDFLRFHQKPLFQMNEKQFYPITARLFYEHIFMGIFHKIRSCYPPEDKKFQDYFGRPFERYTYLLMEESVKTSTIKYQLIPEFKYGKDSKRSPDVLLLLGDKLLAIEVKSYRLKLDSLIGNTGEPIDEDLEKMIIKPLKQLHDRLEEILQLKIPELSGVKEIYMMVVTLGDFPTVPILEKKISNEIKSYFKIDIRSFYHLNNEEYEFLCYLVGRRSGKPIFRTLENKTRLHPDICFRNFLSVSSLPAKRPEILHNKTQQFMKEAGNILFH